MCEAQDSRRDRILTSASTDHGTFEIVSRDDYYAVTRNGRTLSTSLLRHDAIRDFIRFASDYRIAG